MRLNSPKELLSSFNNKIYVFGLLVHNDEVTKELDVLGITTIDLTSIDPIERLKLFKNDEIVILRHTVIRKIRTHIKRKQCHIYRRHLWPCQKMFLLIKKLSM